MSHDHHLWLPGQPPPIIRPHSLAKHRVLRAYLERYVSVLTTNPAMDSFKLTLVDGFSGGGVYLDARTNEERPGSPMLMLEAMKAAAADAKLARTKPFHLDVEYLFIESNKDALAYLKSRIEQSEFAPLLASKIHLIQSDFVAQVPTAINLIRKRGRAGRSIFFLDQFGYSDVPMPAIKSILSSLGKSEIILTFATDFLIDYLSDNETTQRILEKVGISLPSKSMAVEKDHRDWRRLIQFALHTEIPARTDARFYTPFFIRSTDSHRDFWLIHLSGHHRARDVMVGLHWQENTSFAHYGRSGLRMLGYNQQEDSAWNKQNFLPGFYFDETAKATSQEELLEQLPSRIAKKGIIFDDLFAKLTNETPVTSEIMKEVVGELVKLGVVTVKDKSGLKKRTGKVIHSSDVIIPNRQGRLFLPNPE